MKNWKDILHFFYGWGFWYSDPLTLIEDIDDKDFFWVPDSNSLCILWHVGHIAHRERSHIGIFIQGLGTEIIPQKYEIFGTEWVSVKQLKISINSIADVLSWVREVRKESHNFIDTLHEKQLNFIPMNSPYGETISQWLFITVAHTALHIGKIQQLKAILKGVKDSPC